jgi:hypothetical protein
MIEELEEGEVIRPTRRVERDAAKWKILSTKGDEVTFQAGTEVFRCHKSGMIYREWEKEAKRRVAGGKMVEPMPGVVIIRATEPVFQPIAKEESPTYAPMLRLIDSQLEERQHRIGDLRKKAALLDWCNHDKDICTGKCRLIDDIRSIEKRILGDPTNEVR